MRNKKIEKLFIVKDFLNEIKTEGHRREIGLANGAIMLYEKLNEVIDAINNLSPKNKGRE